ncbi:hypothetical protein ACFTQ7_24660 [Lysinibacillus sp. NPDC056959]|uniref:hypothetical protein n=1 Tax=Lysinibacillus sp. NPDC056959 TaxID=3345981 RepID=UPI00364260AE
MLAKSITRTYRQDAITLAYLDALDKKLGGGHSALMRKAIADLAKENFNAEELKKLQMDVLFKEFQKAE